MNLIPTRDHPHNRDHTATGVWFDSITADSVYRVRAGFVATIGRSDCSFDVTFSTKAAAINAIATYRRREAA